MTYLSETQERALRPLIDELPGRRTLPSNYPAPRLRGSVTLPSGQVITAPPVTPTAATGGLMRIFPFYIRHTLNTRTSFSFPSCLGPIIIKDVYWGIGSLSDPPSHMIELGWSATPVREEAVPMTTPRPYTQLTEFQDPQSIVADNDGFGFPNFTAQPLTSAPCPLDLIVNAPRVSVVLATTGQAGTTTALGGYIRIIEGVSPEQLAAFS